MIKRKPIKELGHPTWKKRFKQYSESSHSWAFYSDSLERSANILLEQREQDLQKIEWDPNKPQDPMEYDIGNVFMLIAGHTIETLAKAMLVFNEKAINEKGEFAIKTHKLLDLLDRAKFNLSETEHEFIERLEQFVEWAGRYPAPLKYTNLMPRSYPDGSFGILNVVKSDDGLVWKQIVYKMRDKLENELWQKHNHSVEST